MPLSLPKSVMLFLIALGLVLGGWMIAAKKDFPSVTPLAISGQGENETPLVLTPSAMEAAIVESNLTSSLTKPLPSLSPFVASPAPVRRVLWGAYVGDTTRDAALFETLVGKPMNLQSVFVGWGQGNSFPSEFGPSVRDKGKTLIVFWEQYGASLDAITNGTHDTYVAQFARDAKNYGGPVILAPLHEMNGNWAPWGGTVGTNTPAKVVDAWRHIHDQFAETKNVSFAWTVNSISVPQTSANAIPSYYPGDDYVDYVGIDGFNFGSPWQSFEQIFTSALTTVSPYKKPIYLMSMASAPGPRKSEWILDALSAQLARHPEIIGWVWFNENKEKDWRVNSDAVALEAFKSILP